MTAPVASTAFEEQSERGGLGARVVRSLVWRSGSQIVAQMVAWASTFLVIRLLHPADYGVYAMTQSVTALLAMLTGWGFASGLVRQKEVSRADRAQVFGMLLLFNGALAAFQFAAAPWIAAYYRQPIVADLLRVQSLLYVANPFIALATNLLAREMEFAKQAMAHFASAIAGAAAALGGAMAGLGVWTLVLAPIALFWTRGIALMIAVKWDIRPSFAFRGAGATVRFGLAMLASQLLWFVQTQADVFIGGRVLDPHALGLYTTALFLAQILASKFVPPMNEVAYSAYARLQHDRAGVARAFGRQARLVMLLALPFSLGMAFSADPLVGVALGDHWLGAIPMVRLLACAMPFMTLNILFAPVTNAMGAPRLAVYGSLAGAVIMPACFAVGVSAGGEGLARAWLLGAPLLMLATAAMSLGTIGMTARGLAEAIAAPVGAAAGMLAVLLAIEPLAGALTPAGHLAALVAAGAAGYAMFAWWLARDSLMELRRMLPGG